jgi:hypothetical protein
LLYIMIECFFHDLSLRYAKRLHEGFQERHGPLI